MERTFVLDLLQLLAVLGGLLALVLPFMLAGWVLSPLDRMARWKRVRFQFGLVDYLGLVLLIQIPLAANHAVFATPERMWQVPNLWVIDVPICLVSGVIWWTGVRTFGQAGINDTRSRAMLVFLILPVAYFGAVGGLLLGGTLLRAGVHSRPKAGHIVALLALLVSLCLAGKYTRSLAHAKSDCP